MCLIAKIIYAFFYACIQAAELKKIAGLKSRLCELAEVNMDKLVHDCAVHGLMNNNPVKLSEDDLYKMFDALR